MAERDGTFVEIARQQPFPTLHPLLPLPPPPMNVPVGVLDPGPSRSHHAAAAAGAAGSSSTLQSSLDAARRPHTFTFHSPPTSARSMSITDSTAPMPEVTDTSAASTPTHAHGMKAGGGGLAYNASHPLSAPSSQASDSPSNGAGGAATPYAPVRRSKDRQKHSESENRRRMRLRAKFNALQVAAQCTKKDRFNVLQEAVNKLHEYEARIVLLEQEKRVMLAQLSGAGLSAPAAVSSTTLTPSLSTPLSNFPMLSNLSCCYISLDGRILDANLAFVRLFHFQTPTGTSAPPPPPDVAAAAAAAAADATVGASAMPGGAVAAPMPPLRSDDIYSSSIFALTHPTELIHTLSILRNLLCGVMSSFECSKRCVTMRGVEIDCSMTIAAVHNANKIVMFLVAFVQQPEGIADSQLSVPLSVGVGPRSLASAPLMPLDAGPASLAVDTPMLQTSRSGSGSAPVGASLLVQPTAPPVSMLPPAGALQAQSSSAAMAFQPRTGAVQHPPTTYARASHSLPQSHRTAPYTLSSGPGSFTAPSTSQHQLHAAAAPSTHAMFAPTMVSSSAAPQPPPLATQEGAFFTPAAYGGSRASVPSHIQLLPPAAGDIGSRSMSMAPAAGTPVTLSADGSETTPPTNPNSFLDIQTPPTPGLGVVSGGVGATAAGVSSAIAAPTAAPVDAVSGVGVGVLPSSTQLTSPEQKQQPQPQPPALSPPTEPAHHQPAMKSED